ncbi:NAD(P)H-dependent FMN reductase [Burkholderia sp. D7]|nr:NAD(P)H-dependent FMN reductase [Burkholderia sp. D7]
MTGQQQPRIGIVIGSTRGPLRRKACPFWIHEIARQRTDLVFELIDLRDYPLPFFNEAARLWAGKLATLDGFIVVTPEYNHGPSAVLKNALDYAYAEFVRKPIGFVDYSGVGAARAVEQLRLVAMELQMAPVSRAVHMGMVESLGIIQQGKTFEDFPHLAQAANKLLKHMSWWARKLKPACESMTTGVAD